MKSCLGILKSFFYLMVAVELAFACVWPPGVALASASQGLSSAPVLQGGLPPDVDAGPDQTSDEGSEIFFSGVISDTDTPTGHLILWDFGDGETAGDILTPTYTYDDDDLYVVTLTVTDTDGLVGSDDLPVTVNNVAPIVDAGSDQEANEGERVTFAGEFSDPGILDTHTILWEFGDGYTASGVLDPTHIYGDDGTYTVRLTVSDDDGGVGTDTLLVTVNNVTPIVDAGPDQEANEGERVTFAGEFSDPGILDTHTILWDFGDGHAASDTLSPTHAYGDDGTYAVRLTVSDDDGGVGTDTLLVTVNNVAPIVDAGPDQEAYEGEAVTFAGEFSDPGVLDTHTILWEFGDGNTASNTLNPTHTYTQTGSYTARLTVTDDDGGSGTSTAAMNIVVESPNPECPAAPLSDIGSAVAGAIGSSGDPAHPELSGVTCGSFPVDAETSLIRIPGAGGAEYAYQRYHDLIAAAEYEVEFTTMTWDDSRGSELIIGGISELYQGVISSSPPHTVTVRLLSGREAVSPPSLIRYWLARAGVPLSDDNWRVEIAVHRNGGSSSTHSHVKLLVVDGKHAIVSGYNVAQEYFDPVEPDYDMGVELTGRAAHRVLLVFDWLWWDTDEGRGFPDHLPKVSSPVWDGDDDIAILSLFRDDGDYKAADEGIVAALDAAETSIDILQNEFKVSMGIVVPPEDEGVIELMDAVVQAVGRGVRVRIILTEPGEDMIYGMDENRWVMDMLYSLVLEEHPENLDKLGIKWFRGIEDDSVYNHAKAIAVDEQFVIIGSQNWHYQSFGEDDWDGDQSEYNLGVDNSDFGRAFTAYYDTLWESSKDFVPFWLTAPCESDSMPWGFDQGVTCGMQIIQATLAKLDIEIAIPSDPPIPGMLFSTAPFPSLPPGSAQGLVSANATHGDVSLSATLTASHTVLYGNLEAAWTTDAWAGAQFIALSVPQAQVYDEQNTLVATGAIQARPVASTAVALALGDTLSYVISGTGAASFYAPATDGLGVGGTWLTYTAQLNSAAPYGVGLRGAIVSVDGQEYTGTLTLVTTHTLTLQGQGHTLTPNFSDQATIQAANAALHVDASALLSGDLPFADPLIHRFALSGYTGTLTITEHTPDLDLVELDGTFARDLALTLTPPASSITPTQAAAFQTEIHSNQDDTYAVTVIPPLGWQAQINSGGQITITPPLDAQPGDYSVRVEAQSVDPVYSPLFSTAVHTVTIQPYNGMQLSVAPDPSTTAPWGPIISDASGAGLNNGQAQVPGAAYLATITNTSTSAHTFAVQVIPDGFPSEWIMLGGAGRTTTTELTLPAGGAGRLGVYISPVDLETLPLAGTEYPFTVHAAATDEPALDESAPAVFTMPAVPFNYLKADPPLIYAAPDTPASFDVRSSNVGNVSGTFVVKPTTPDVLWEFSAPYSVTLGVGATDVRTISFTPVSATLGQQEIIHIWSPAPGSFYAQRTAVGVRIVGACAFETSQAVHSAELLNDMPLAIASNNLAFQLDCWECAPGDDVLRDRTVAALNEVINRLQRANYPLVDIDTLEALAAAPTIAGFCDPMADLADQLTSIAARDVALDVTPGVQATLPGRPVSYTIRLSARGSLTTTYDLAVNELPFDASFVIRRASFVIPPGESVTTTLVVTPAERGVYPFAIAATAQQDSLIERRQTAALRVVDAWFQIIAAQADPAYVEMGDDATNLSAAIANTANLYWPAPADVQILAPDGTPMHTRTVPITLTPSLAWEYYDLGSLNVSGWPTGVYTISVRLPTPTGETWGEGLLGVGQAIRASHAVSPTLVPPGTVTPTIIITTEISESANQRVGESANTNPAPLRFGDCSHESRNTNHATRPPGLAAPLYQIEPETTLVDTLIDAGTGLPVANASGRIRVYQPSGYGSIEWREFTTDGNGVFTVTFDTPISQTVRLYYYDLDGYADQYYDRKPELGEADLVTLQYGDNPFTTRLNPATRLVDTLLDDNTGLPIANASGSLRVYQPGGYGIVETVSFETDAAGVYTVTFDKLISQTVRLHYYDLDGYADQYYERKPTLAEADPLFLQSGDNPLITRLSPATRLVNTLLDANTGRPVANESGSLRVYQPSGYGIVETVSFETDAAGVYTVTFDELISQTVRLHYYDVGGHLDQYYDRKLALAEADPLPLRSGGNALTTYLLPGTRLVNTLLDARTGRPISYTWGTVTVYEETGADVIDSRDFGADADGVYTVTFGLAISQTVRLGYRVDGYPPQYRQLRFSLEEADPVPFQGDTNSLVTLLSAYVPRLSPDAATAFGPPARPVVHRLRLQNGGSLSDTYSLTLAGQAWSVAVPPTVGPLAPGAAVDLEVAVTVPPTAAVGDSDAVTLTVASTGDPNLTDTSVLTTTAANALLQMCIALDGSGSISSGEFSLMKDGLANAIRDESVTPQNGSVEISVVQYGADLAQVEVHPTVILGAAAAEEAAGQIEAIEQIGLNTPTDLGIDLCTALMTNSGQFATAGAQVVDLPTDGAPDDESAAVTARENAVAAGVDEVNAEAIDASTYAIAFLRDQLVYPQPGYDAPPFIPGRGGFVIQVSDFERFAEAMRQKLQFVVDTSTYLVRVEHSLPVTGVIPLIETAAPPPLYTLAGDEESQVVWQYVLSPDQPLATATFQALLPQMEPGEVRRAANGTLVRYTGTGGAGEVRLGPLYVSAAHLVAIAPLNQTVGVSGLGRYEVTLFNPTGVGQTYDLSVVGLPAGLTASLPPISSSKVTATLGAGQVLTVPLIVAAGAEASFDALPAAFDFSVVAATARGGRDAAQAALTVMPPTFALSISPDWRTAGNNESVTYTLTLTNLDDVARTYALDAIGLDGNQVSLPPEVSVAAGQHITVSLHVTAHAPRGLYPFDVQVTQHIIVEGDESRNTQHASAVLVVSSERGVAAGLTPSTGSGQAPSIIRAGQNSPAAFTLAVTNTGSLADAYTLTLSLPDGWSGGFRALDSPLSSPVSTLSLPPYVFNAADRQLVVTPAGGTPQGFYPITATAVSALDPGVSAQAVGYVQVSSYGVTVEIDPATTTMDPRGSQTWDVTVTNAGSEPDTFHLTAGGVISVSISEDDSTAQFSANPVSLAAGASTVVQLTAHDLDFALAQTYPFVVQAQSQADPDVAGYDTAEVTFLGFEQVAVTVAPLSVTLTDTTAAQYLVFVTNTGNLDTDYALSVSAAPPGPDLTLEMDEIYVPAHLVAGLLLTAEGRQAGVFTLTVQASSTTGLATGAGSAILVIEEGVSAHPPEAVDDVVATTEDTPVTVDVLANDSDPDGDPLTVISMTQPFSGTAVIGPDDTVIYTPTANWYGTDAFSYTIGDGHGGADDATVTVSVAPVNDPPVAMDDDAATLEDTPVAVDVLANDSDPDGDPLTVISMPQSFNGLVVVGPDSTLTYTPTTNWYGTDAFSYTISDGHGGADDATVTVSVAPVNDPPAAVDDDAATLEDAPVAVNVLANDYDVDGDPLTVVSITQPLSGVVAISLDDTVTYTPTTDWHGVDAFAYTISDGQGGVDSATVTVTVSSVNDPPVAADDYVTTTGGLSVTVEVLANDYDVDGDLLAVISVTRPLSGTAGVNPDHTITYTPTAGLYGADSFTYTISDGQGGLDVAIVRVVVITGTDCELYPIALHVDTLAGVEVGEEMEDIYNGDGPGNFGWLSWTGDQGVPTLAHSLTPPSDSDTYIDPDDPEDHHLSVDDWVRGRPGVGNAEAVRNALDALMPLTITLPVWDVADGQGANLRYHVVGFARVQITDYRLPGQNRISAIFWGTATCPEPGASASSIGREVCEGNFWTCDLLACRNVIGQNTSRFSGKEWPMR